MFILDQEEKGGKVEDVALNALGKPAGDCELVEAVVDSGAVASVTRRGLFDVAITPSEMSKAGKHYRGPDGSRIPNLGQQAVEFLTEEGHKCGLTMQVADVERPLIAVSHLSEAGNDVSLNKRGGWVTNLKSGKKIAIQRKGNLYVLRMWVKKRKETAEGQASASVFPRPGRS